LISKEEILDEIEKISDVLVIVEGIKDKKALEEFGFRKVVTLSRRPLFQIIEEIAAGNKKVMILTDFDKKGKELYGKLHHGLQRLGVVIDNSFREFLQKNTKLSHIEGLVSYINNI
jgi:5S rRNA maturation endonuclease (ribonuclease M5)